MYFTLHVTEQERELLKEGLQLLYQKRRKDKPEGDSADQYSSGFEEWENGMAEINLLEAKI